MMNYKSYKTTSYVILNKSGYFDKIDHILSDTTKSKKVNKDITEIIKQKANKIITAINVTKVAFYLPKIIGDFQNS